VCLDDLSVAVNACLIIAQVQADKLVYVHGAAELARAGLACSSLP
jgi:hypothetical protein